MTPGFSEQDFDELSAWLMRRGKGIFDIVELEGFLTAIVIGPNAIPPTVWLPKVWGGTEPKFKDLAETNRFVALVMSYHNEIVGDFEHSPQTFEPTFYESDVDGERVVIVDEWCAGFLKGMRLDAPGWKSIKRERPDLLKPLTLFGSPAGWRELEAGGESTMHATWSPRVAPAVREIYGYWVPYRTAVHASPESPRRH
jgi:uncharacterized protein